MAFTQVRHELVSATRRLHLKAFHVQLKDLCDKYAVNLQTGDSGEIEVIERDFVYPDGYEFSATIENTSRFRNGKLSMGSKLVIDRWWYEDVPL